MIIGPLVGIPGTKTEPSGSIRAIKRRSPVTVNSANLLSRSRSTPRASSPWVVKSSVIGGTVVTRPSKSSQLPASTDTIPAAAVEPCFQNRRWTSTTAREVQFFKTTSGKRPSKPGPARPTISVALKDQGVMVVTPVNCVSGPCSVQSATPRARNKDLPRTCQSSEYPPRSVARPFHKPP